MDIRTGKYLGSFGQGTLNLPTALAVDPVGKTVLVGDNVGLKRYDASTGRLLATLQRNAAYGSSLQALRFGPDGSLYAVAKPDPTHYRLLKLSPATGAILITGIPTLVNTNSRFSIGVRAGGNVEVFNQYNATQYSEDYVVVDSEFFLENSFLNPTLDRDDIRVAGDGFLRITSSATFGGIGNFNAGVNLVSTGNPAFADFAEAANGYTFLFLVPNAAAPQIASFDTFGQPIYSGYQGLVNFAHGTFADFAIYEKSARVSPGSLGSASAERTGAERTLRLPLGAGASASGGRDGASIV